MISNKKDCNNILVIDSVGVVTQAWADSLEKQICDEDFERATGVLLEVGKLIKNSQFDHTQVFKSVSVEAAAAAFDLSNFDLIITRHNTDLIKDKISKNCVIYNPLLDSFYKEYMEDILFEG